MIQVYVRVLSIFNALQGESRGSGMQSAILKKPGIMRAHISLEDAKDPSDIQDLVSWLQSALRVYGFDVPQTFYGVHGYISYLRSQS